MNRGRRSIDKKYIIPLSTTHPPLGIDDYRNFFIWPELTVIVNFGHFELYRDSGNGDVFEKGIWMSGHRARTCDYWLTNHFT